MPYHTVEKLDEGRVFFDVYAAPGRGEVAETLSSEREQQLALQAKLDWEKKNPSKVLVQFHRDPLAGGLRPHPQEGNDTMVAAPMWVAEILVRTFKDEDEAIAWRENQK